MLSKIAFYPFTAIVLSHLDAVLYLPLYLFYLFYRMRNMKFLLLIVCIAMATAKKDWRRLKRINKGLRKYQLS